MPHVAFLGTGLIGHALVEAAVGRGWTVSAWNRNPARSEDLAALGVRVTTTAAAAIEGAERIHLALTDDAAVDSVLDSLVLAPDQLVIDHTTTSVPGALARARSYAGQYLHAPVFMSPASCRSSTGVIVVAGPQAAYARVADALACMTGKVWYVGERPDLAAVYKLLGNSMILTIAGGLADVFALAGAAGLQPTEAMELFSVFDPGGMIKIRGARMAAADYTPSFHLSTARKDVRLMLELADGAPLAQLPASPREWTRPCATARTSSTAGSSRRRATPGGEAPPAAQEPEPNAEVKSVTRRVLMFTSLSA